MENYKNQPKENNHDILKLVCTLSHGQSSAERGFSRNEEHLVQSLQEESLIALRTVIAC